MLKAFRKLIGVQKGEEKVNFDDIEEWVEQKIKETTLPNDLADNFNSISASSSNIAVALKKIIRRVLKISKEQSDSVEDYRDAYTLKMQTFLKQIIPEKKDIGSIVNYGETLSAALAQIDESTKNQFSVIKKFFPEEAEEIEEEFSTLWECNTKINSLIKKETGIMYISEVKRRIKEIRRKNHDALHLREKLSFEENKKKEAEEFKVKLETDLDDLKTSPEYERYDQLISKKIKIEKEVERESENLRILFSPVIKMLDVYDKKELGADRALARQYVQDTVNAVLSDKGLWIIALLQSIASKLPEIEQNEAKRIKLRQAMLSISENSLKSYISKYDVLNEAMRQVKRQISVDSTTAKVDDIKYKLGHANEQIRLFDENKNKHETAISEIDSGKDLLMLEKKLSSLAKVKIC